MTDLGYLLQRAFRVKDSDMSVAPGCHNEFSTILDQCSQGSDRAFIANELLDDAIVSSAIEASDMALLSNHIDGVIVNLRTRDLPETLLLRIPSFGQFYVVDWTALTRTDVVLTDISIGSGHS